MRQNFLIRSPVLFRRHTSRLNSLPSLLGTSPSSQNSILLFSGWVRAPSGIPSDLSYCFFYLMADPSVSHSSPSCPALIKFSMSSLRVIFLSSPFYVVVFFLFKWCPFLPLGSSSIIYLFFYFIFVLNFPSLFSGKCSIFLRILNFRHLWRWAICEWVSSPVRLLVLESFFCLQNVCVCVVNYLLLPCSIRDFCSILDCVFSSFLCRCLLYIWRFRFSRYPGTMPCSRSIITIPRSAREKSERNRQPDTRPS